MSEQIIIKNQQKLMIKRSNDEKFCENCGHLVKIESKFCPNCGRANQSLKPINKKCSSKSWLTTLMLTIFPPTGLLGFHRFYAGKIGTGFLWLISGGGFVIGWIYDILSVCMGEFRDGNGQVIDWLEDENDEENL